MLARRAQDIFIEGDIVPGNQPGAPGPICVLNNQFKHLEKVVFRFRIRDKDGKLMDDKVLKSIAVEMPGDMQATIDASTHDGHISLGIPVTVEGSFSSSRINGKMNGGGQAIIVRTGDGSIHLNKS